MLCKQKIGERLKALREGNNEKQTDIANLLNVQRQIISYYETGARMPNVEDLAILAEHFNTSVDYLLGISDIRNTDVELKAVCEYTGLSDKAINRLTEENVCADDISDLKLLSRIKARQKETFDFLNFLFCDFEFWGTVDLAVNYKKDLVSYISLANDLIAETSNIETSNLSKDEMLSLYNKTSYLLNEKFLEVRCDYFDTIEKFKACINQFVDVSKKEVYSKEEVLNTVQAILYSKLFTKRYVEDDGTEIIQLMD